MTKREIKAPRGYDARTQKKVGLFAAQLDDQLKRLKNNVKGLTTKQLEWQPRLGMNSIGMLIAHNALVEVWWILIAPKELSWSSDEAKKTIKKECGFEDDGLPLKPRGRHPRQLKGYSVKKYDALQSKVRRSIHRELKTWKDRDLDKLYALSPKHKFSRAWTLYHVLEHFANHFGQILMLKHMMGDAGVLKDKKK